MAGLQIIQCEGGIMKPKCEDIGFDHAWMEQAGVMTVGGKFTPYPNRVRTCTNCGKRQKLEPEHWVDYPYEPLKDSAYKNLPWDVMMP